MPVPIRRIRWRGERVGSVGRSAACGLGGCGCRVGVLGWAGLTVDEGCDETPVGCYVCFAPFYEMLFSCGIFLVEEIFYRSHHDLFLLKGGFYHQIAVLIEEANLFLGQTGIVLARRTNRVDF